MSVIAGLGNLVGKIPNPFNVKVTQILSLGPLATLANIIIIVLLVWVTAKYFTRNKLVLIAVVLLSAYYFFL